MDPFDKFLADLKECMEKTPKEEIDRLWNQILPKYKGGMTVGDLMKQSIIPNKHEHKVVIANLVRKE